MNILFITEIAPFPPRSGERIRSVNLIHSILQFSDRLILIAGNEPPDEPGYEKVTFHQFPDLYSRSRWMNLGMIFWRERAFIRLINQIIERDAIDLVFLDYCFIGNYIKPFRRRKIPVIYGTHNIQSDLHFQIPARSLKDRIFRKICYLAERSHELIYFRKADAIITVSDEDKEFYKKHFRRQQIHLIPNYLDEKEYEKALKSGKKQQIIMTGTFYAFQNVEGLKWFLREVWDDELSSLANMIVVGQGSKEKFSMIKEEVGEVENVEVLGSVPDVKEYLAESKVAIIPLLHGSGTRLKCLEAMALKTNIVGTSLGVEGIRHNGSILTADDPEVFKISVIKVLRDEIHNEDSAHRVFLQNYSSEAVTPKLEGIVRNLLSSVEEQYSAVLRGMYQ